MAAVTRRFEVPADLHFTCSRCGDCCRGWDILLGPGEEERLAGLDWGGHADDLSGVEVSARVRGPGLEGRRRLARRADGRCVFLGAENECRLHAHFGDEAKPLMCRLYPFGFHPLDDRVAVDVSFACRAVSRGEGAPVESRVPEWTRLLRDAAPDGVGRRHYLRSGMAVSGKLLWEIEHDLLLLLASPDLSLLDRVRAMLQYMRIATTGDPTTVAAAMLRRTMTVGIPKQVARAPSVESMDKTQRAVFNQWLYLALNPTPDVLVGGVSAATRKLQGERVAAAERFRDRRGRPTIDNRPLRATFDAVAAVDARAFEDDRGRPVELYLRAKIVGQKLLLAGVEELPLVEAVPKLLLTLPMTIWTSKALAAERGGVAVEEVDVRAALRLIDRTFGVISTAMLPKKQREAYDFVMVETDVVEAATNDLLR